MSPLFEGYILIESHGEVQLCMDKILVVEDELTLMETLKYNLERQGYQVYSTGNGLAALEIARREHPDLILLDIMLPGLDGLEVCRILRQEMSIPILMLTARDDEIDKVVGLEVGADDYMTKPFSMRELLARVKAQLRRVRLTREEMTASAEGQNQPEGVGLQQNLTYGDLTVNVARREVLCQGEVLPLKLKEYELLVFLLRNQGIVLSRDLIPCSMARLILLEACQVK